MLVPISAISTGIATQIIYENDVAQTVALIEAGPALGAAYAADWSDGVIAKTTLHGIADETNKWLAILQPALADRDNLGTVGYFAQSAVDFWLTVQDLINGGAPPHVLTEQFAIWRDYTTAQVGKEFSEMEPIDIWFGSR